MDAQFKKGVLEMCVLVLLQHKDRYGYELIQLISKKMEISEGAIYPVLRRLTKEGYFTTYLKKSKGGPSRKYYQMTQEGKRKTEQLVEKWHLFVCHVNELIEEGEQNG